MYVAPAQWAQGTGSHMAEDTPFLITQRVLGVGVGFVQNWWQFHLLTLALFMNLLMCSALLLERESTVVSRVRAGRPLAWRTT